MRHTLVAGFIVAVALVVTPVARADWKVTVGLGQQIGESYLDIVGCHLTSQRPELTLRSSYGKGTYTIRMRAGDSVFDRVVSGPYDIFAKFGVISLEKIEGCVGTFKINIKQEPK